MARNERTSMVSWHEVGIWTRQLEDKGYRARVVVSWESGSKIRVSITLSELDTMGKRVETHRDGELISDMAPGGAEKAALRAAARLMGLIDESGPQDTSGYIRPLPARIG